MGKNRNRTTNMRARPGTLSLVLFKAPVLSLAESHRLEVRCDRTAPCGDVRGWEDFDLRARYCCFSRVLYILHVASCWKPHVYVADDVLTFHRQDEVLQ